MNIGLGMPNKNNSVYQTVQATLSVPPVGTAKSGTSGQVEFHICFFLYGTCKCGSCGQVESLDRLIGILDFQLWAYTQVEFKSRWVSEPV